MSGTITQLSTGSAAASQTSPQISGSNVVWTNTVSATSDSDIWFVDLSSTQPARDLTNTPSEQEFLEDVDGANVVWTHTSASAPGDIVVYDTTTSVPTTIAASSSSIHFEQPAIQGRYVVYLRAGSQYDVDGYDNLLGLPLARPITNDPAMQAHPRIFGDLVVYEDYNSGSSDVFGYRIATAGPPFAIATGTSNQSFPDVDPAHVVWIDDAGGTDAVFLYDIATGTSTRISHVASHKIQPRVSGNFVVWADDRNAGQGFDIYLYDIAAGQEQLLIGGTGDQVLADVDGSRIVYTSNANGFEQVYLFTLATPPPPPPPNLPFGCDPAKTDLVGAPVTLHRSGHAPAYTVGSFSSAPGSHQDYYVCVDNGLSSGAERTAHLLFAADGDLALTPADFKPSANPPHYVSEKLELTTCADDNGDDEEGDGEHRGSHDHGAAASASHLAGCAHRWSAAMFGAEIPATATLSIRIAK